MMIPGWDEWGWGGIKVFADDDGSRLAFHIELTYLSSRYC